MTGSPWRRSKQLLHDLKETRGYWESKKEALDSTLWRTCFGRGYGLVVRTCGNVSEDFQTCIFRTDYTGIILLGVLSQKTEIYLRLLGLIEFYFCSYSPLTQNTNIMRMFVNQTVYTTILVTFMAYAIYPFNRNIFYLELWHSIE